MPELPEVETIRTALSKKVEGSRIASVCLYRSNLRYPFQPNFCQKLIGASIEKVGRRAKYLVFSLNNGAALISHLGMSGVWRYQLKESESDAGAAAPLKHDHVAIELEETKGVKGALFYNDPRRFGFMSVGAQTTLEEENFSHLGVEPMGKNFHVAYLCAKLQARKTSIKSALLDQSIVAGLGNIYVCEALWRSAISPLRRCEDLMADPQAPQIMQLLQKNIRKVLQEAITSGGSSLRDYVHIDGKKGYFQHQFAVYNRENKACLHCGAFIKRIKQNGRSSFYCPSCQH